MGGIVRNLYSGQQDVGYNSIIWNSKDNYGKPVSAGLYFYSIESVNYKLSGKMLLVK
jgi:flagellar hook assembly protein FlgD